jgi:hypothetical protein
MRPDTEGTVTATDDEEPPWRTPAGLLDNIELEIRRACGDADGGEGVEWHSQVMLCIILPELREVLREAGLDVPEWGPYSAHHYFTDDTYKGGEAAEESPDAEAVSEREPEIPENAGIAPLPEADRETALYRWWDEEDLLLYVGETGNLGSRTKGHVKGSSWMEFAARSSVVRYPSRSLALASEEVAIKTEHPLFNFKHNNTPEARQRLVEYLIRRNRLDLLVPAVSRG